MPQGRDRPCHAEPCDGVICSYVPSGAKLFRWAARAPEPGAPDLCSVSYSLFAYHLPFAAACPGGTEAPQGVIGLGP